MTINPTYEDLFGKVDLQAGIEGAVPAASSGDGVLRTIEQCEEWAEKFSCNLRSAGDNQLFVDIDTEAAWALFNYQLKLLEKHLPFRSWTVSASKQGLPHRHVVIDLAIDYPLLARIALQACLGSDPTRELLSIRRAMDGEENVVIFFEPKSK
jgi:hypothetical protein